MGKYYFTGVIARLSDILRKYCFQRINSIYTELQNLSNYEQSWRINYLQKTQSRTKVKMQGELL